MAWFNFTRYIFSHSYPYTFDQCIPLILEHEGGFVNNPNDHGGATNRGITLNTYQRYVRTHVLNPKRPGTHTAKIPGIPELKALTLEETKTIYRVMFWDENKIEGYPKKIRYVMFDACVNHRAETARKLLQRTIGVSADGVLGKISWSNMHKADPFIFASYRQEYYEYLVKREASQQMFLDGWLARNRKVIASYSKNINW